MNNPMNDHYWQEEFEITTADLDRIAERMRKEKRAFTLTEMVKRLVRGRLEHGADLAPAALPKWIAKKNVLSWDAEDKWTVGSQVLVARSIEHKIRPYFGFIVDANTDTFFIRLEEVDDIVKYARVKPGSKEAMARFESVKKAIYEMERATKKEKQAHDVEELMEIVILKHGSSIAGKLLTALQSNCRFIAFEDRWFLEELLILVSRTQLNQLRNRMLTIGEPSSLSQMLRLIEPPLSIDGINLFSLHNSLLHEGGKRFENLGTNIRPLWKAVKPPVPPWEQAVVRYYAYDPTTYQILVRPGEKMTQRLAQRLQELGLYAEIVTVADEL